MSVARMKSDFRFALLIGLGAIGISALLPIAVWRGLRGEYLIAAIDSAMVVLLLAGMAYIWRRGWSEALGWVVSISAALATILVAALDFTAGVYWVYGIVLVNAMLLRSATCSLLMSLGLIVAAGMVSDAFAVPIQRISYFITAMMSALFAWAFTVRNNIQHAELERLAMHDVLTGLQNRRAFNRRIGKCLKQLGVEGGQYTLALLDIDNFKQINDRHGHDRGDGVLRALAELLSQHFRGTDSVYRIGGEEFVLVLPGGNDSAITERMEALRRLIENKLSCEGVPVTASIGLSAWQRGDDDVSWLSRADAAMYRAKREGRNRVVLLATEAV
ncbi:MAG: diguanylate cyclase [Pseudomonadota bacterium]|nr:diguanylate cyclase [Pseudomonadota bacterium]MDO5610901.1 diguanylate cyclase [Pseudomonadota bacterium]